MNQIHGVPADNDKYFIVKSYGGYSPCIQGNTAYGLQPFVGSVLPNCVGASTGAFNKIIGAGNCNYLGNTNAKNFVKLAKSQGLEVGTKPVPGSVMCWDSSGAGHVAFVNDVISDTKVSTWESGWSYRSTLVMELNRQKGGGTWGQGNGYTFIGFIYNPQVDPYRTPKSSVLKKGMRGDEVRWLQWILLKEKCFTLNTKSQIDGSFGNGTFNALKKFQKAHSLAVDGYCGPASQKLMRQLYTLEGTF